MKVRVKFAKHGPVRYIGHLDVMRFFQKCIRRAGLDIAYTGGYSPHQIMSFAQPLGLGIESDGEYMDIELNSAESSAVMQERLNAVSVPGIIITDVKLLPQKAGNAMASVAAASYTVRFREGREPSFDYVSSFEEFLAQESILITKETKKSKLEVDLKPGIYSASVDSEGCFFLLLDASSSGNIKPSMLIQAFLAWKGEEMADNALFINRNDLFTHNEEGKLVSMNDIGTEIMEPIFKENTVDSEDVK